MGVLRHSVVKAAARNVPRSLAVAILACLLSVPSAQVARGAANSGSRLEYEIKAAMLYNFARFVEWPEGMSPAPGQPLVFGVIGQDPFGDLLDKILEGEQVYGHPIHIKRFTALSGTEGCHLLFISDSVSDRLPEIIRIAGAAGVLTVAESDGFCRRGGMIGLVRDGQNVRFEIAIDVAQEAGFRISSKLLRLAKVSRGQAR